MVHVVVGGHGDCAIGVKMRRQAITTANGIVHNGWPSIRKQENSGIIWHHGAYGFSTSVCAPSTTSEAPEMNDAAGLAR
jgi:hypothetical protein